MARISPPASSPRSRKEVSTYLGNVLALELRDQLGQAIGIGLDADGREDGLDVLGGGGGVATEAEEEVSCEVLHFVGFLRVY